MAVDQWNLNDGKYFVNALQMLQGVCAARGPLLARTFVKRRRYRREAQGMGVGEQEDMQLL